MYLEVLKASRLAEVYVKDSTLVSSALIATSAYFFPQTLFSLCLPWRPSWFRTSTIERPLSGRSTHLRYQKSVANKRLRKQLVSPPSRVPLLERSTDPHSQAQAHWTLSVLRQPRSLCLRLCHPLPKRPNRPISNSLRKSQSWNHMDPFFTASRSRCNLGRARRNTRCRASST